MRSGPRGLTLRAVARASGTTTPPVYKRLRSKAPLCKAVGWRILEDLLELFVGSTSVEQSYRRYSSFTEERSQEFRLLSAVWAESFPSERPGTVRACSLAQLAYRLEGSRRSTRAPSMRFSFCATERPR
jgi:AcrR family transcriptional regulator